MREFIVFLALTLLSTVSAGAQNLKFGFVEDDRILDRMPAVKEVQKVLDQETELWDKRFQERQQLIKVYLDSLSAATTALEQARQDSAQGPATKAKEQEAAAPETVRPQAPPLTGTPDTVSADSLAVAVDSVSTGQKEGADAAAAAATKPAAVQEEESAAEEPPDTLALLQDISRLDSRLERAKKEAVAFYHRIYGEGGILARRNEELSQSVFERVNRAIAETGAINDIQVVFDASVLLFVDQDFNLTEQILEKLGLGQEQQRSR
ncbi:MAG: OmpH family outer membrane protein [Gemmatimonadota bacterium]|nr:OmpH family outer membrane protein [Gemmatimonadota bacterium]